ncbi:MAG: aldo/keto reductase [Anaerolineae bacterium]
MQYRKLGRSDLQVSVISLGCWALAGDAVWGPQDERDAAAAIHAALDCGINLFDTTEAYGEGRSEELLGRALAGRRQQVLIGTKVLPNHQRPQDLRAACEASLRRLQTDYVDIYYLHWPNWDLPIAETLGALQRLQQEGKVRVVGVSNYGRRDLTDLLAAGRAEVDQLCYSLLWRAIEDEIIPCCLEHGVGIACYSPLAQGLLTGKFASADEVPDGRARTRHFRGTRPQARHGETGAEAETFAAITRIRTLCEEAGVPMAQAAVAWLLAQPGVATVIAGGRSEVQVRANAAAADLHLPDELLAALTTATEELKAKLGPNPDMWQAESRIR